MFLNQKENLKKKKIEFKKILVEVEILPGWRRLLNESLKNLVKEKIKNGT